MYSVSCTARSRSKLCGSEVLNVPLGKPNEMRRRMSSEKLTYLKLMKKHEVMRTRLNELSRHMLTKPSTAALL